MRVHYPAHPTGSDFERLTGQVAADPELAPYPVVVLVPGVNVPPDGLRWLASHLAARGLAVVTYALVGNIGPGAIGISPDIDAGALAPDVYGSRITSPSIPAVLAALEELNDEGLLAGCLDLDRLALGGHSAGGTVALHNADPKLLPGLRAVFTYAAHTMVSGGFGYPQGSMLAVNNPGGLLLMAGEHDGVIAGSRDRYGVDDSQHDPVERTFREALATGEGSALYVELAGATHFGIVDPVDPTTARTFLDPDPTVDPALTRAAIAELVEAVLADCLLGAPRPGALEAVLSSSAISKWSSVDTPYAPT